MKRLAVIVFAIVLSIAAAWYRHGDSAHAMGLISLKGGKAHHPVHLPSGKDRYTLVVTGTVIPPYRGNAKVTVEGGHGLSYDVYGSDPVIDLGLREYSDKTAEMIDGEVKQILDSAYEGAQRTIAENREKVEAIADALLKFETITGEEVNALIRGESLERPGVADLLDSAAAGDVGMARPVSVDPEPQTDLGGGALPQPSS